MDQNNLPMDDGSGVREFWDRIEGKKSFGLFGKKEPENMPVPLSSERVEPKPPSPVPQAELPMDDGTGVRNFWAQQEKPKSFGLGVTSKEMPSNIGRRVFADPLVGLTRGALVGIPEAATGLLDVATLGQVGFGKAYEKATTALGLGDFKSQNEYFNKLLSDETREAQRKVSEAKGFIDTTFTALTNPSAIVQTVAQSIPPMVSGARLGGAIAGLTKWAPELVGKAAEAEAFAAKTAGVKEGIRQALLGNPKEAAKFFEEGAKRAKDILSQGEKDILKRWATIGGIAEGAVTAGQNLSQVRGEAPEGEVTATQALTMGFSGALTGLIGVAGGRLAARMGIPDFDTLAAAGRKGFVADKELGIFKRLIGGAIQEGIFEELPQSIQEQMAQNIAQGKPISEGALEAGAMGMLAGFAQSMGVNVAQKTWEKARAKSDPTTQKLDEDIKKLNLDFGGIMDVPEALETKDYKSTFGITPKGFTPTEIPPTTPPPSTPPPAGGGGGENLGGVGMAPTAPSGAPRTVDEVFKRLAEGREGVPPLLTERTGQLQQGEVEGKPQVKKAVPGEGLGVGRKNVTPEEYAGGLTPIEKKRFETRKEEAAKRLANPKRGTKEKAAKDVAESGYEYNPAVMVDGKVYTYGAKPTPAETKKGLHGPIMDNIPGIRGAKDVQTGYVDKNGNFLPRLPEKPVESPVKAVEAPAKAEAPVEPAKVENAVNLRDSDVIDSVVTVLKSKQFRFGAEEAKARVMTVIGQIGNDQVTMDTLLKSSIAGKYVKPTTKATIPPVTSPVVSAEEATKRRQEFEKSIEKPVSSEPKAIEAPVTPVTPVKPNLEAASKVLREQTQSKKDFNTKLESAAPGTTFTIAEGKHAGTWTKLKKVWKHEKGMTVSKDYGKLFGNRDEIEKTLTLPQAKAPTAGKMKGPQNLVSYIQSLGHLKATGDLASKMGGKKFVKGKGWVNTGKMTVKEQGDLGKVVRIEGKLNLDEFVQDLHETFPNPKGGQWTADDLVEALISGQARNIKPAEIGYEADAEKLGTKWAEEQAAIEADKPPILKVALPKNESEFLRLVLAHELPGTKSEAGGKEYTHDGDYWNVNGKYISRNDLFDYLEKNNLLQEFLENFEVAELEVPVPYFESHLIDEDRHPPTDMDIQNALSALPDGSVVTVFRDPSINRIPVPWWEYEKIDAVWHLKRIYDEIGDKNELADKYNIEKIIKSEDLNAWAVAFGGYLSFDIKSKQILLELSATNKDIMNLMRIPRKPDWQDEEAKSFKAVSFNPEEIEKQKEIASVVEEAVKDAPQAIVDIEKQGRNVLDKKAELEKEDKQIIENSKEEGLGGLEKSAKLFVQGDKVVVSGQRGTVVSVNGPLVRVHFNHMPAKGFTDCPASIVFHDDGAAEYFAAVEGELEKEKKRRGRKKKEEDITEDSNGYTMKLESDNTKLILILGRQQYGASLGKVLLKEMLQNSFDTIKEAVYKGVYKAGNLTIRINDMERTVEFIDDGMGMSAKTLREAFFTIGGSQKDVPPELASGGLGLAKMALFTSAEKIRVETTQAGETEKRVCEVTAIELIKSGDKDGKPFKVEKQTSEKSEHGTSVKLWIPESFMIDGKYVYISFPSYDSDVWDSSIMTRPLLGPINVNVEHYDVLAGKYEKIALDIGEKTDNTAFPPFRYKVNCPDWGWMDVYYGEERKSKPVHQILSSGIYQFHHAFTDANNTIIPYDITINVFSKVKTDHNYYPFNNTRESWRSSISADIEGLTAYLLRIARGNEAEELLENFKDVVSLPMFDWEALLTKTGDEFEKAMSEFREQTRKSLGLKQNEISEKDKEEAKKKIEQSNYKEIEITKNGVDAVESETPPVPTSVAPPQPPPPVPPPPPKKKNIMTPQGVKDAIKNETHKAKNIDIEGEIKDPKQFLIDIGATTKAPIFHSNLNKDFTTIATKGNALDFFSKLGSIVVEMKRDLSNSNIAGFGKELEEEWYAGVSLDKEYGGLWLVVPYRVVYLNPLYTLGREPQTFSGLAEYLYKAAIHEFAHMTASGHGEWHNQVQMMLEIHMADSGLKDYYINAFRQVSAEYFELWRELSNEFDKSTTQNVGRGLKEHEGKRLARGSALSRTNNLASEFSRALSERHSIEPPYPGDQRLREDRGISEKGRYSARGREAIRQTERKTVKNVDLKQIQELFGGNVKVLQHGSKYFIETKSGHFLSVNNVSEITPNETIFEFAYGRKFDPEKEEIIGDYDNGTIRLVKDKSGKWTLAHESIHWMEDVGILSKQDVAILKAHIKKLAAEGKFKPESKRNIGNAEDRANFIADQLVAPTKKGFVAKVLDKIRSFIDGVRSFVGMKPTAGGIVRAIKSGKVYEGAKTKPQVFSGAGYAVRNKESDNFKRWFKQSKVSKNGDPITMYHATTNNFDTFMRGDIGFHAGTVNQAHRLLFGRIGTVDRTTSINEGSNIMPIYMSIQKPLRTKDLGSEWDHPHGWDKFVVPEYDFYNRQTVADLKERFLWEIKQVIRTHYESVNDAEGNAAADDDPTFVSAKKAFANDLREVLLKYGYDGIVYKNMFEKEQSEQAEDSWIALKPEQIKSIYNIGTWSDKTGNIKYAVRKKEEKGDIQETLPGLSDEENFQLTPEGEVYRGPVQPKKKEPEQGRLFAARKKPQNLKDRINLYNEKLQVDFKALNEIIKNPRPVGDSRAEIDRYLGEIQITEHSLTALAKEISKELPKERQHAISRWMRAGGDMSLLREWAKKYPGDKSYKDALALTKDEKEWAEFFVKQIENDANLALRSGLSRSFAINYMKDAIFSDVAKQKIYATVESPLMQTDPEKAMKYILKELGKAPKSIGASFIASRRALHDSMSLKAMLTRLSKTKEEDGRYTLIIGGAGKPLKKEDQERLKKVDEKFLAKENIREMNRGTRDYRMFEHPSMFGHIYYDLDENDKQTFYAGDFRVHPAAYAKINALLGKSLIRTWKIPKWIPFIGGIKPGKIALKAGAWIKGTMLGMSPFHLTHTGSHAVFHDVNPFNLKEIDFEKRPLLREGVNHGLLLIDRHAMDVFREGLAAGGLWNSLPTKAGRWVGETHEQFTKFTFENMIPRMKADVFEKTVASMEKKFAKELASGQMTRDQMLYIAAATANNAFGGQNYRSMGRNPTLVDAMRLILLAPDFLESRLKFFGQALTRYGSESRTALIKSAIYMSVIAQIANVLIGDDKRMHWEKPFTVIAGGREWTPRSVAGDIIHLVTDWRNFAYNRLNPLFGKPGAEIVTGRDRLGRKMEPEEIVQSAFKGWIPIPLQGAVREPGTELLDSLRNTMFQATGISNYPYRSQFDREVQEAFQKRIVISASPEDRKRLSLVRKFGNEMKRLRDENQPITDVYMKMQKAVQNKEMFKEDIKLAYQRAKQNTTMVELKSLQAEDLAKLWGYATPEERQMYNRIKKVKFKNLRENHPERYSKMKEKYPEVF